MWWKDCGTVTNAKKRNRYLSINRREFKHHEAIYLAIKKKGRFNLLYQLRIEMCCKLMSVFILLGTHRNPPGDLKDEDNFSIIKCSNDRKSK